jgi:hypothetical protein
MMGNRYIRIIIILGMVAVVCGTVNAVAVGVVANTQAMSAGGYPVCTAPCECISESTAAIRWGAAGYERCDKTICGQDARGDVQYYCIHKIGSTVSAATAVSTVTVSAATTAVTTTAPVTASQETVNAPVTSAAVPATPSPALLETGAVTRKSPVGIATILAAIGAALLAASGMRRK